MRQSGKAAGAGVGLKARHYQDILAGEPAVGWFEIHAENFMGAGGAPHAFLERIRALRPLSVHGVGLSIGGAGGLDRDHLRRLKQVVDRYQPDLVSEHLAWSTHRGRYFNDLLALPYTTETLDLVCNHLDEAQETLGRSILLENPSTYVTFTESTVAETDFITEVARRTGCGLLLDVNNVHVSCVNQDTDPAAYLDAFPLDRVREIHLAGHALDTDGAGADLLIDTHDCPVAPPVWNLFARVLDRTGPLPTLIEWDNDVPEWAVLAAEAARADRLLSDHAEARHVA